MTTKSFSRWLTTTTILTIFLLNSVSVIRARSPASPDYESYGGGGDDGGAGSSLSDAYDAALLEVSIAADKQLNTIDSTEVVTENVPSTTELSHNSTNHPQSIQKRADSLEMNENVASTTMVAVTDVGETTTPIPLMPTITKDYARKGKQQLLEETAMQIEDETTKGPYAMKRYETEEAEEDSLEVENQLAEHQHLPLLHQVLRQAFRTSNNNESAESIQLPSGMTVVRDYDRPVVVQTAGLPSFVFSYTRAPPTKSSVSTTSSSIMTATPAPASTQPTYVSTTAPSHTTSSSGVTSIQRPASKQAKQINITRRKLLPHEQLRNYIEDAYIRMPLAVIIDPSAESLEKTKALWNEALASELNILIVLVALNDSGEPAAYNFNNSRQFLTGLNSIKEHNGGNAFVGIMHAAELVPYDSAVFIFTAAIPQHTEIVQDAAITLLKKRIRLYLVWYGEPSLSENETQEAIGGILGEVAMRSGGETLHIVGSENSQEIEGSTLTISADVLRGPQELDIPVESTLSSLHVKIDAPMRTATLETPNGG